MATINEKGLDHISKLTVPVLKHLLQYVFLSDDYKRTDIRKPELIEIVRIKYEEFVSQKGEAAYSAEIPDEEESLLLTDILSGSEEDV